MRAEYILESLSSLAKHQWKWETEKCRRNDFGIFILFEWTRIDVVSSNQYIPEYWEDTSLDSRYAAIQILMRMTQTMNYMHA